MNKPRANSSATVWLATSGLIAGASVVGSAVDAGSAGAFASAPSSCPSGTYLVATRTCQLYVSSSTTWNAPSSVTSLQILAVGGGGGGGGGTSYAPGGGGGGGAVRQCTVSLVDLSHAITITRGAGGAGGADGSDFIHNKPYGSTHGVPGSNGGATKVQSSKSLCVANGGKGGQTGWHYLTTELPATAIYGGGGNSGSGVLGGSAEGLVNRTVLYSCQSQSGPGWQYNIVASGGGGGSVGSTATGTTPGIGGLGSSVTGGLFTNFYGRYGGGGGGGGGTDCTSTLVGALGGIGGGGTGGGNGVDATAGAANMGGGGGGGGGSYASTLTSDYGVGFPGANGGSGVVIIRFAEPNVTSNAYFDTAKSVLTPSAKSALNKFVATAIATNMATVVVTGYADPRGSAESNLALSVARANETAKYLRQQFAAKKFTITITATGKGATNKFGSYALDRVATVVAQGGTYNFPVD